MKQLELALRPVIGGLVILVALIFLIGTAIKNPQPHDIPVGLVGPAQATQQLATSFGTAAPGAFQFTTYASEQDARAALDARTVDGVLLLGQTPHLVVAGAAGDAVAAGCARLIGAPGLALAGLVAILLSLVTSGGPVGSRLLPDFYRALAPWMPAGQLYDGMRGALFFESAPLTGPIAVLTGWLVA